MWAPPRERLNVEQRNQEITGYLGQQLSQVDGASVGNHLLASGWIEKGQGRQWRAGRMMLTQLPSLTLEL